eukprot:CAMPEP_0172944124 /NCGR_PEP_ID=MMETSP1075-20121228/225890_1 /TAXON_ID=2916 /ORGANISM="Ceratium fusus, Strain PA161109" /LENGTH=104 /DNA_ID=CAMNT_0013805551 /DNA_START=844 /DNA_END=1159 /DNA_ORIENTATION=-
MVEVCATFVIPDARHVWQHRRNRFDIFHEGTANLAAVVPQVVGNVTHMEDEIVRSKAASASSRAKLTPFSTPRSPKTMIVGVQSVTLGRATKDAVSLQRGAGLL